jgi:hypothetical protein
MILTSEQINMIISGREILSDYQIAHDQLYEDTPDDLISEKHSYLAEILEEELKNLGFTSTNEFHIYSEVYSLIEKDDETGATELLDNYQKSNG